jgi:thiamine-phosphate pyrophosphorylase
VSPLPRLYAIADSSFSNPVDLAKALFDGGVRLVQIRNKTGGTGELLGQVDRIVSLASSDARVIVNDRADVARISGAAGVHLGQTDLPASAARAIVGPGPIVGLSTHNMDQALEADQLPVDYIAVGPVFRTSTKPNADPVVGLDGLAAICRVIHKPVVAIGGIQLENARKVLDAGAHSIAVIRDLLSSSNVQARSREWIRVIGT